MKHFLQATLILSISVIVGCGSPRSLSVSPGTRLAATTQPEPTPREQPSFTMEIQEPANVQTPLPCPGCIGVGYDNSVSLPLQLTSTGGFIGRVTLSVSGLPADVFMPQALAPVSLNVGNGAANQLVNVNLYVMPGVTPGSYPLTIVGTPLPGANSTAPVSLPVTLTITSGVDAAWRAQ
jgi:hypothetical protein